MAKSADSRFKNNIIELEGLPQNELPQKAVNSLPLEACKPRTINLLGIWDENLHRGLLPDKRLMYNERDL